MISLRLGDRAYPDVLLHRLGADAPDSVSVLGSSGIVAAPLTAWFCSERVPPDLVLPSLELAAAMCDAGATVASGFHSPVERECLRIFLAGDAGVVVCLARDIGRVRLPREWRNAVESGRMAVISACARETVRPTARSADLRNRVVAAIADQVFFVGATPGGRLHRLAREIAGRGQRWACFDHPGNEDLLLLGADPIPASSQRTQPAAAARSSADWT